MSQSSPCVAYGITLESNAPILNWFPSLCTEKYGSQVPASAFDQTVMMSVAVVVSTASAALVVYLLYWICTDLYDRVRSKRLRKTDGTVHGTYGGRQLVYVSRKSMANVLQGQVPDDPSKDGVWVDASKVDDLAGLGAELARNKAPTRILGSTFEPNETDEPKKDK